MPVRTLKAGCLFRALLLAAWAGCLDGSFPSAAWGQAGDQRGEPQPPLPEQWRVPPSPALSPAEELKTFRLQPGFVIELFACEPMVQDPVAMAFDERGRLWVAEMRGYMMDIDGRHEHQPNGRISVLEDRDGDGRAEISRVFLEGLVLPRAVARASGGLIFAADGQLWFAGENPADGRARPPELIDPHYVTSGNVEHQPNGLLLALDNWIYNAKSKYRYRRVDGRWIKDETEFRGQWGMAQDDYGRLFYNYNYSQLHADIVPPNVMGRNSHHLTAGGLGLVVTTNQAVFPIRMNTGVNRGYRPGILDDRGRLLAFASSCAPAIYRGHLFPPEFAGNAFVCAPGANLIKRNLVREDPATLRFAATFAYENGEFLASTDERFRPVQILTGPDGALYVADMYRGIIQHRQYMTSHLRREILARHLDQPIHHGRIWRIRPEKMPASPALSPRDLPEAATEVLVETLAHPNGFWRDTAQRLLVERADPNAVEALVATALRHENHRARVHALWTLEGLGCADSSRLRPALHDGHSKVQVAAVRVLGLLLRNQPDQEAWWLNQIVRLAESRPALDVQFQMALSLGDLPGLKPLPAMLELLAPNLDQTLFRDGILSGLHGREMDFLRLIVADPSWRTHAAGRELFLAALSSAIYKEGDPSHLTALLQLAARQENAVAWRRQAILEGLAQNARGRQPSPVTLPDAPPFWSNLLNAARETQPRILPALTSLFAWPGHQPAFAARPRIRPLTLQEKRQYGNGQKTYLVVCAGCHGAGGEGLSPLAPPLVNSSWVLESEQRLVRILLQGLEGPIHVHGTRYEPPLTLPNMPSLASMEDGQIAEVLTYIRRAWGHGADPVTTSRVKAIRDSLPADSEPLTEALLLTIE